MSPVRYGPLIVVIDGHDASGKTSVSRLLAARLGGKAVRPFPDALGDQIAWMLARGYNADADRLARAAVERIVEQHVDEPILWFDRHWASIHVDLPAAYHPNWDPLPPTVFCWIPLSVTLSRLAGRGEDIRDRSKHDRYCSAFPVLAEARGVPIIDTSTTTVEAAADRAADLLAAVVGERLDHRKLGAISNAKRSRLSDAG